MLYWVYLHSTVRWYRSTVDKETPIFYSLTRDEIKTIHPELLHIILF